MFIFSDLPLAFNINCILLISLTRFYDGWINEYV